MYHDLFRMYLRRLIPILVFILALPVFGFGQEKNTRANEQADPPKVLDESRAKQDPARVLKENQQKKRTDAIKSVPVMNKNIEAIRQQNKKATMQQMHTINKAIRKSMTVHKRK